MASTVSCHLHTVILIIVIVLILAFTEELFHSAPVLVKLFTDSVNFMLVIALVILVLLIDLPCGILLSFLVLYMAVYVKRMLKTKLDSFQNIILASQLINNNIPKEYLSESEINYNNTKPFTNNNITPFQPIDQSVIDTQTAQMTPLIATNQNDALTVVGAPNRDGYDIAGCRYDFKDSQQNMTKYGPPLSACGAYNPQQVKQCGTLFYPLNA